MSTIHGGGGTMAGKIDVNRTIRDLLDVARIAVGPGMMEIDRRDAEASLVALIAMIESVMPVDLQKQDIRLQRAKALVELLKQTGGNGRTNR